MKEYYVRSVKIGKKKPTMEMSKKWGEYGEESFFFNLKFSDYIQ